MSNDILITADKDWQGWTEESDMTRLEYFINENVSSKCTGSCKDCGYWLLNTDGHIMTSLNEAIPENITPLCGKEEK